MLDDERQAIPSRLPTAADAARELEGHYRSLLGSRRLPDEPVPSVSS